MANSKISALTSATTPLAGTETLPIVQAGAAVKATVANITGSGLYAGSFTTLASTGNTTLGDASTDTVRVNGYMGVGATPSVNIALQIGSTALAGAGPIGFYSNPTGPATATTSVRGIVARADTAAAAFTVADVMQISLSNSTKGAGSTITNQHGVYIADQTQGTNNYGITSLVSSGTNKWNIYASGTAANYFAGSVGIGTNAPTELLTVVGNAAVSGTGYVSFERNFTPTAAGSGTPSVQFRMVTTGTTYVAGSDIGMLSDGAWSATSAPGIIRFRTTPAGSTTLVDRMRIDSAGNVGIGAIPNAWGSGLSALDMGGNSRISGNSSLVIANNAFFNGTNWIYKNTAAAATYTLNNAGIHYWATAPSGTAGNTITFVTGMTLSLAGGLSVGTTTDPGAGGFINTGNTTLGDASTDTVTVNGYMGVGGAGASTNGLQVVSTALTGAGQIGVVSSITATSSATNNARAYYGKVSTAASAFTVGNLYAVYADDATKGAGSTITNQHGLYINDQTQGTNNYGITSSVSSGTNKWNIYASGTAANYFAGTVGIGATANASALLDVQSTTKGVRMPNMTTVQKNAIATPAAGLMVFDTTLAKLCVYSGAAWQTITST